MADVQQGTIKIIELVGISQQGFSDAVRQAVAEASKSVRGITGVDVMQSSAKVSDGQLTEYHVNVKIAFTIERGQ